jgi:hypothetical protein
VQIGGTPLHRGAKQIVDIHWRTDSYDDLKTE